MKRSFKCPILHFTLQINHTSVVEISKKLEIDKDEFTCDTCIIEGEGQLILWISNSLTIQEFMECYLTHELNHIYNIVFKEKGIKIDYENDELESYYKQFVYSKVLNILKEMGKIGG